MKKFAICLLLAVVVGSFAFAIEGVGDFTAAVEVGLDDVNNGNDRGMELTVEPSITYSRAFGGFGIAFTLGDKFYMAMGDKADAVTNKTADELYVKLVPSYTMEAGPGTLGLSVAIKPVFYLAAYEDETGDPNFKINPVISYSKIGIGIGELGFEVGTDDMGVYANSNETHDGYGLAFDDAAYFKASFNMEFGLSIWVSPRMFIKTVDYQPDSELTELRADVSFGISDAIKVGVEGRFRLGDIYKDKGIMVKPHVDLGLGAIAVGIAAEIDYIANGYDPSADIQIKPIINASFKF